jgi:pimeloyl-ACP methyl ester carboxylesterase
VTRRVEAWRAEGEREEFRGHRVHVYRRDGRGPPLVLLHGFPSSSFDWRAFLERERERAVLAFDFLGFGLSDKPRDHDYSLHWQADLTEELVRRHLDGPVFFVSHDIGTSVATELMARDLAGRLSAEVAGMLLFNGSVLQERAKLTPAQRLLRSPLGRLAARLTSKRFFLNQFGSIFSRAHPLSPEEGEDQWALLTENGGHRLGHRLIGYMRERAIYAERWHGAFRDWPGRLSLLWGLEDPVAHVGLLQGLRELRPGVPVAELPDAGHYPQIEVPDRFADGVERAVDERAGERG